MKKALLIAPMSSVHERFNIANIDVLAEMGFEIHLAANFSSDSHSKKYADYMREKGILINDIPFERASLFKNLRCILPVKRIIAENEYSIVHCHTETGGIITRIALMMTNHKKTIYTPHGMSFYKGSSMKSRLIYKPIEQFICSAMDINIAMNNEEYSVLKKWNNTSAAFVHGAGVDIEIIENSHPDKESLLKEFGVCNGRKILLSIGELNDNKNHIAVIKALSLIPDSIRPHYIICGEGDLKERLLKLSEDLNVSGYLTLAGYRYDIPDILKIADVFVFPSYHEGLPASVIQAMAASLPVVCSKIRGNTDLIDNEKGGFFVRPDDSKSIADGIVKLLKNDELKNNYGEYNKTKSSLYSIESVKKQLKNIYSQGEHYE